MATCCGPAKSMRWSASTRSRPASWRAATGLARRPDEHLSGRQSEPDVRHDPRLCDQEPRGGQRIPRRDRRGGGLHRRLGKVLKLPPPAVASLILPAVDTKVTAQQVAFWIDVMRKQNMLTRQIDPAKLIY